MCGDGTGEFDNVLEPHGQDVAGSPADYDWNYAPNAPANQVMDLQFWSPTRELMLLNRPFTDLSEVRLLAPSSCSVQSATAILAPVDGGLGSNGAFYRFVFHAEGGAPATQWDRFVVVGPPGLGAGR